MIGIDPFTFVSLIIILSVSIWLHEYAHAWSSVLLGDPTPKIQNRLTPNPLVHIDIVWFLMIFIANFWWWKPVEVNPSNYKNPLKDWMMVACAWPFSNLLLSLFWTIIIFLYWKFWLWIDNALILHNEIISWLNMIFNFWTLFVFVNIWLAIFNMIPIPPLDWFYILKYTYPNIAIHIKSYELYYFGGLLLTLFTIWNGVIRMIWSYVYYFLFLIFSQIFY